MRENLMMKQDTDTARMIAYDPAIHHRKSIRLKDHDYAGGGLYFVTICAHREFIEFAQGNPFGVVGARPASLPLEATQVSPEQEGTTQVSPEQEGTTQVSPEQEGTTQVSPVRELIEERMRITAEKCPFMKWEAAVIMPDHMHALIRMQGRSQRLGDVIGGFKAAVSRELRRRGDIHVAPDTRIWHRNYYEMIVRTQEAEKNITEYIRMNPWKLVQHGIHNGQAFRMIGNPALLNREKIAMLCSRDCPPCVLADAEQRARSAGHGHCFIGGFHSLPEQSILRALLESQARLICCPARGIDTIRIPADWLPALEANRMLILEMRDRAGDLTAAEERNKFVLDCAEKRWLPHVSRGGMLDRLLRTGDTHFTEVSKDKGVSNAELQKSSSAEKAAKGVK
jgi:putative transposase